MDISTIMAIWSIGAMLSYRDSIRLTLSLHERVPKLLLLVRDDDQDNIFQG